MLYRKLAFVIIIFIVSGCLCTFAQEEKRFAVAYGLEINNYAAEELAGGPLLNFNFNLSRQFAAGVNFTGSTGGYGNSVIEPGVFLRYYFAEGHTGFFAQTDFGIARITEIEENISPGDDRSAIKFMGGIRGGYRLDFLKIYYAEPYIRAGYPFLMGAGILMGYRF